MTNRRTSGKQGKYYTKAVSSDYEPADDERKFKDEFGGWLVAGQHLPDYEPPPAGSSNAEDYFDSEKEIDGNDPSAVYENWISESNQEKPIPDSERDHQETKNGPEQPEGGEAPETSSTPAERVEDIALNSGSIGSISSRLIGLQTADNTSNSRRQAIDDDQESNQSTGYISPARTQYEPTTDSDGKPLPKAQQRKYKWLEKYQDSRFTGYNDTENATRKVKDCSRIASTLELSSHQRRLLRGIIFELEMDDFGNFSTSQVVLFAAFALLRSEYMRHHLSYEPGTRLYPDASKPNQKEIQATELLNLENHAEDFDILMEAENKAAPDGAPEITRTTLRQQANKIKEQGLIPDPEYRYKY